jgi:hypothetical protein
MHEVFIRTDKFHNERCEGSYRFREQGPNLPPDFE